VKVELSRRVEAVTRPEFLERSVRPYLNGDAAGDDWQTRVLQLDDDGAATVEIGMDGRPRAYAKLYFGPEGAAIHAKIEALRSAGFGAGARQRVVEPLAFLPEHGLLLTRAAEGPALSDHIAGDERALVAGAEEAGAWLARLHRAPIRIGLPQPLLDSGEPYAFARRLVKVVSRQPDLLRFALEMIGVLERLAGQTVEGLQVQSHGQYRPIHVFLGGDCVTVIDLDRSRPCDPARDVAEFLHRLRAATFWKFGTVAPAEAPSEAFLRAYAAAADRAHLTNLRYHRARYIVHSLNSKLKKAASKGGPDADTAVAFYRSELDAVLGDRPVA
jgi:hypothetical protein